MWIVEANDSGIYEVEFPTYDQVIRFRVPARNKQHALSKSMAIWLRRRKLSISENIDPELAKWGDKARINRVADAPDQYEHASLPEVQSFTKVMDKQHPGATIAESWKKSRRMRFMTFDQLAELMDGDPAFISVKLDGELVALFLEDENVSAITSKGTIRTDFPAATEAAQMLSAKHKKAILMAEMYVVNEEGQPQSYMKASKVLRDPDTGQDSQIRLAVFDLISLDDTDYEERPIEKKMQVISELFKNDGLIHPAFTIKGEMKEAKKLWDQLEQKGWEGLVVHIGDQIYKIKPIMSYDLVVVAIEKSQKYQDRIGAVLGSFMDKESRFRLSGSIGGGFSDHERREFYDWAQRNKIYEDEERIWVDPFKEPIIIEVEAVEVNIKERPKLEFKDRKWVDIENDISGVLRFPQFLRVRDDKKPEYEDVRIEQLPIKSMDVLAAAFEPSRWVKVVTGQIGQIRGSVPNLSDAKYDFNLVVEWSPPLWGEFKITECHPTEVIEVMDSI